MNNTRSKTEANTEHEKTDLRVQRTQQALADALLSLLGEKEPSAITVSDLCERAMVRRATFYRHYSDKSDFMRACITQKQRCFREAMLSSLGDGETPVDLCESLLRSMLAYLGENRLLLQSVSDHMEPAAFAQSFTRQFAEKIAPEIRAALPADIPGDTAPMLAAVFICGGVLHLGKWWALESPPLDEDALISAARALLNTCGHNIIRHPNKGGNK